MHEGSLSGPNSNELDGICATAYQKAVTLGRFDREQIARALGTSLEVTVRVEQTLTEFSLLHPMPGEPETLVPVSPEAAAADLVGPTEQQIHELQQAVTDVRTRMRSLQPAYFESRRRRNQAEAFDVISDIRVLQAMLDDWGARCRTEILTAQPGGARPPRYLENARPLTLARLARGVRVRHLYQHTVRSDLTTTSYIRAVAAAGAEVRTTDELIDRIIIYDREAVFLPEHVEDRPPGAVVVREPTLVAFLCKVYEHLWDTGTPFTPGATAQTPSRRRPEAVDHQADGAGPQGRAGRPPSGHVGAHLPPLHLGDHGTGGVLQPVPGGRQRGAGPAPRRGRARPAGGVGAAQQAVSGQGWPGVAETVHPRRIVCEHGPCRRGNVWSARPAQAGSRRRGPSGTSSTGRGPGCIPSLRRRTSRRSSSWPASCPAGSGRSANKPAATTICGRPPRWSARRASSSVTRTSVCPRPASASSTASTCAPTTSRPGGCGPRPPLTCTAGAPRQGGRRRAPGPGVRHRPAHRRRAVRQRECERGVPGADGAPRPPGALRRGPGRGGGRPRDRARAGRPRRPGRRGPPPRRRRPAAPPGDAVPGTAGRGRAPAAASSVPAHALLLEAVRQTALLTAWRAYALKPAHSTLAALRVHFRGYAEPELPMRCTAVWDRLGKDADGRRLTPVTLSLIQAGTAPSWRPRRQSWRTCERTSGAHAPPGAAPVEGLVEGRDGVGVEHGGDLGVQRAAEARVVDGGADAELQAVAAEDKVATSTRRPCPGCRRGGAPGSAGRRGRTRTR